MSENIRVEGYLTIEPEWRNEKLTGATIARVTKNKPRGGSYAVGSAVIRLAVEVPRRVFLPFEAFAEVEASESEVGIVRVVVEPFNEEVSE